MSYPPIAVVTGGAGFIGSHVVDLLVETGFAVRVIDNLSGGRLENIARHASSPGFVFEQRDIRSYAPDDPLFRAAKYVFHLAGIGDIVPSIERPIEYMSANVQGTIHMLECARCANVDRFVYAASSSCYGIAQVPTGEDHPIAPRYPYALSKYQGEQAAFHWHQIYKVPVNALRIFNAYGTRSRTSGVYGAVFGVFLRQKIAGEPFTVVGDGTQQRDFLYVTDAAKAFLAAAETRHAGRFWNLGAGKPQSINRLADLLGGHKVYIPSRPGEPHCTWANIAKIEAELDWRQEVGFEEGVARTVADIETWRNAPLWDPDSIAAATRTWFKYLA